jgi:hypothetical protein
LVDPGFVLATQATHFPHTVWVAKTG